jgi:hypothetical protein
MPPLANHEPTLTRTKRPRVGYKRAGPASHMTILNRTPGGTDLDEAFGQLKVSHMGCTVNL